MALITEDGTGLAGAESYISVADADTYHTNRGNSAWTDVTVEATKEAVLRKATEYLDNFYRGRWKGNRRLTTQALAWPRTDVVDEDGYAVDHESVPTQVANATAEAALREIVTADVLQPDFARGGAIKAERVQIGPIEEDIEYQGGAPARTTFTAVSTLLSALVESSGFRKIERS